MAKLTHEGRVELAQIGVKLGAMQLDHDTRLLAPALLNHAVYLYRLLARAGMLGNVELPAIMAEFTAMALAPNNDTPPTVMTTGTTSVTKN